MLRSDVQRGNITKASREELGRARLCRSPSVNAVLGTGKASLPPYYYYFDDWYRKEASLPPYYYSLMIWY